MAYCCSYDELRATDTSIAAEVLAKADEYDIVVPTNKAPSQFLQLVAENTDVKEETLDGKNTTHAASMVVFQRRSYGPEPPPVQLANRNERQLEEGFTSYKSAVHLGDDLKSLFILIRLNKSGLERK